MLGNFRIRMLAVIIIAALAGLAMQSGYQSREIAEPVLHYVLKDYGVEEKIALWIENMQAEKEAGVQVMGTGNMQSPCAFISVVRPYGWHWNPEMNKQEFSPGIIMKVEDNTLIKPILEGRVEEISENSQGRMIRINHDENTVSYYGGLEEILVEVGQSVAQDQVIGKCSDVFYLELQDENGPINPNSLFE